MTNFPDSRLQAPGDHGDHEAGHEILRARAADIDRIAHHDERRREYQERHMRDRHRTGAVAENIEACRTRGHELVAGRERARHRKSEQQKIDGMKCFRRQCRYSRPLLARCRNADEPVDRARIALKRLAESCAKTRGRPPALRKERVNAEKFNSEGHLDGRAYTCGDSQFTSEAEHGDEPHPSRALCAGATQAKAQRVVAADRGIFRRTSRRRRSGSPGCCGRAGPPPTCRSMRRACRSR